MNWNSCTEHWVRRIRRLRRPSAVHRGAAPTRNRRSTNAICRCRDHRANLVPCPCLRRRRRSTPPVSACSPTRTTRPTTSRRRRRPSPPPTRICSTDRPLPLLPSGRGSIISCSDPELDTGPSDPSSLSSLSSLSSMLHRPSLSIITRLVVRGIKKKKLFFKLKILN